MPAKRYALILAAGFGSRMGTLGRELPKPLWPIFETTIIGHLINQLRELGFEKVYVNAHHQSQKIASYIKSSYPEVEVLFEDPILDSAGCLINCAQEIGHTNGELFTFNGDNLIDLKGLAFEEIEAEVALYSEEVAPSSTYNRLKIVDRCLREIMKPDHKEYHQSLVTYAGISRIKLSYKKLRQEIRPIGLFKGFLNFENEPIQIIPFRGKQIDLGTFELYTHNLRQLVKELCSGSSRWEDFLALYCGLDKNKLRVETMSYNATGASEVINFSGTPYLAKVPKTFLFTEVSLRDAEKIAPGQIYWKGRSFSES